MAHPNAVTMVGRTIIFAMLIGLVIKRNQTSFPRDVIELKSELTTLHTTIVTALRCAITFQFLSSGMQL